MKWMVMLFVAFVACAPQVPEDSIEPTMPPAPPVAHIEDCVPACANLNHFSCPAGIDTSKTGVTCVSICQDALSSGYIYWPATCVKNAKSKQDIIACGISC